MVQGKSARLSVQKATKPEVNDLLPVSLGENSIQPVKNPHQQNNTTDAEK